MKYSNKQFDMSIRSISVLFLAFANTMQIVTTTIEKSFAIITIKREPVNSMNLEMWQQLQSALDACEDNHKLRGIVITSGLEKSIFTAGNDILELVFRRYFNPSTHPRRASSAILISGRRVTSSWVIFFNLDYSLLLLLMAIALLEEQCLR